MNFRYSFSDLAGILSMLKKQLRIAVIYAGNKHDTDAVLHVTSNTRSWKSYEVVAHNIADALRASGFKHIFVLPENIRLLEMLRKHDIHIAWLNSAGVQGVDPMAHAPAVMETAGIPYIGHNPTIATILDNKHHFKSECVSCGIPTGRFLTWDSTRGNLNPLINSFFKTRFAGYYGPFIIKPTSGRASIGVSVVEFDELSEKVAELYQRTGSLILVEEYFSGPEYCVSVSGPLLYRDGELVDTGNPFVFSELERVFEKDELIFTSMDVKPISNARLKLLDSSQDDQQQVIEKLHAIAHSLYLDFALHALVRIDVRADIYGNLFVLEANPKPDLKAPDKKSTSLVVAGLEKHNIQYADYIYALFANGLHYLLQNRQDNIAHIIDLFQR